MKTITDNKIIQKRVFKGPKDHVFTSPYMPSHKWAVAVLIEPTEDKVGGINYATFKTKEEAEQYNPENASIFYDGNFEKAVSNFEVLKNLKL